VNYKHLDLGSVANDNKSAWAYLKPAVRILAIFVLVGLELWLAVSYGRSIAVFAASDGVRPSEVKVLAAIPSAILMGIEISISLCVLFWLYASPGAVATWLREKL
jgi:hypothetical protein